VKPAAKTDEDAAPAADKPSADNPNDLPLVVSMGGMAASGGYYVSMASGDQTDVIFAEPTTWTGSIGVVIPHYTVAGLMEKYDVQEDSIKSHPLKQMGAPTRKMTAQEREIFQGLVDDSFARFKEIVKSGRPRFRDDPAALDRLATGQVFTTRQAIEGGLVDREGFIEEAIDRALELGGLDKKKTEVIDYDRPISLFDIVLASQSSPPPSAGGIDLAALLNLTAPRAYYMCTWLPTLAQNRAE
jgi:protease-4